MDRYRPDRHAQLEATLHRMENLEGILPMRAACKKIRDDGGEWEDVEGTIAARSVAQFPHGLCPTCVPRTFD